MVSFPMRMKHENGGRSSTSSHYSAVHDTIGAGTAEDEFYGIPLKNNLFEFPMDMLVPSCILILVVLIKPSLRFLQGPVPTMAFWVAVLAAAYAIKEVTLYPLVTSIIFTRTSYPYMVVIPHCIAAAAAYRKERSPNLHYLPSFGMGFFCYGFGGSIVSDVLMGLPATALGHYRIVPCYVLGWILVWFSPEDIVYKLLNDKRSFVHYFLSAWEAVDAVTTPMGRVSRSARELQNKGTAPIMAGLFAGTGGAAIRYGERVILRKGDDKVAQDSRDALEAGVWRTLGYSVLWWYVAVYKCTSGAYGGENDMKINRCHEYSGNDFDRFAIVVAHVIWNFACDLGIASGHPFVMLSQFLRNIGLHISAMLDYGPRSIYYTEEKVMEKLD